MKEEYVVAVDIGGTNIKGAAYIGNNSTLLCKSKELIASGLKEEITAEEFLSRLVGFVEGLSKGNKISGIGVSTAGIVNYAGTQVVAGNDYLAPLKGESFTEELSQHFSCPVTLINDCDAAMLGAAVKGYLNGDGCIGLMAIGTGLGFSLWKNGRKWMPNRQIPLLGAIATESGNYDQLVSGSLLASQSKNNDLTSIFAESQYESIRNTYLDNLSGVIQTACVIYDTEQILIGGGLANAINNTNFDFNDAIAQRLKSGTDFTKTPSVKLLPEGNELQLIGAANLAMAESAAKSSCFQGKFSQQSTEIQSSKQIYLEKMCAAEIISRSFNLENRAGEELLGSIEPIAQTAEIAAEKIKNGGRLIYVGCGTSGRVAAMDAVELNCTYGLPKEQSITLISGGVAEASISIEENFEEDASAVPDLLLLSPNKNDVVIGISASGTAYYVRSALACARQFGATTILISNSKPEDKHFFDKHIALNSGAELVTGSTRMKAGTATKKVLNAISTTAMVLNGKVAGTYMINMLCLNDKLVNRAQTILKELFALAETEAHACLANNDYDLSRAVLKRMGGESV